VVVTAEEQQDGVTAELEQVGVLRVRPPDQLPERRVDHARDLLRALAAAFRECLGQIGEAGDVGEGEGSLEALGTLRRRVPQPVDGDARNERPQGIGRRVEPSYCHLAHRRESLLAGRGLQTGGVSVLLRNALGASLAITAPATSPQNGAPIPAIVAPDADTSSATTPASR
jgi:hypothetical protein